MLDGYVGILFLGIVGVANGAMLMAMAHMVGSRRATAVKGSPYESGIVPLGSTRERYSVNFYIVAMLFIVLDIETLFLIPWAVVFRRLGLFGFLEMLLFILVVGVGLVYAWRKGALEWD
ncbi:MAG: NADH-quinone oxidoreductase subunit A [Gemmatimonadota bacterium]